MKRLLILSGKGGTGKTTVSAAIIRLSQARAIADCDVDAPNLHLIMKPSEVTPEQFVFMGGEKAAVQQNRCIGCGKCLSLCRFDAIQTENGKVSINEYACEGCGVCQFVCPEQAITLEPDAAGTRELYSAESVFSTATLKMGRGNSGKLVTDVKLAMLKAAPPCELAVIDGSPGIGCPVIASVSGMDLVLIVAEPSESGISDLQRLVKTVATFDTRLAVCINKWNTSPMHSEKIQQYCAEQHLPFVGKIPFDPKAVQAVNEGKTIADVPCPAGDAVKEIYTAVLALLNITNE